MFTDSPRFFKHIGSDQGYINPGLHPQQHQDVYNISDLASQVNMSSYFSTTNDESSSQLYECNRCHLHLFNFIQLDCHIRRFHSNDQSSVENTWVCNICSIICDNFSVYIAHLQHQHDYLLYPCHKCKRVFYQQQDLNIHVVSTHHISPES